MPHPSEDELASLAAGGLPDPGVSEHVEACAECEASMAELRNAIRHLRTVPDIDDGWVAPPAGLWERVVASLDEPEAGSERPVQMSATATAAPAADFPDRVVADLDRRRADRHAERQSAPRRRTWLVAGLAAASLVVGLTAGRFIWGQDDSTPASVIATAPLDTLDTKVREGSAAIERVDGRLDLRVAPAKALDPGQGYLEVWLINRDLKRMVSIGVLRSGQTGLFPVSQSLLDQGYVIVDVSREAFDDKPQHSGVSLLRGQLPA